MYVSSLAGDIFDCSTVIAVDCKLLRSAPLCSTFQLNIVIVNALVVEYI